MSVQHANKGIIRDNLVLYYDTKFINSFRGEATTNMVSAGYESFEIDVGSYNTSSSFATQRSTDESYFGDYSLLCSRGNSVLDAYANMEGYINVSPNTTYTLSSYIYLTELGSGFNVFRPVYFTSSNVYISENLGGAISSSDLYQWKRKSFTFTTPANASKILARYSMGSAAFPITFYADGRQLEEKNYATDFVIGSRTNLVSGGGGFLDISKISKENVDTDNIEYDSSGPYVSSLNKYIWFGGTNSYLQNLTNDGNSHTFECWWMPLGAPPGANDGYFCGRRGSHSGHVQLKSNALRVGGLIWFSDSTAEFIGGYTYPSYGVWAHLCYVVDEVNNLAKYFVNGVQAGSSYTITKNLRNYGTDDYHLFSGSGTNYSGNGRIGLTRFYSKALSAPEILQNYNAQKHLYGH
jgi:hypothetical protein